MEIGKNTTLILSLTTHLWYNEKNYLLNKSDLFE